jgi:hypothetical protein
VEAESGWIRDSADSVETVEKERFRPHTGPRVSHRKKTGAVRTGPRFPASPHRLLIILLKNKKNIPENKERNGG